MCKKHKVVLYIPGVSLDFYGLGFCPLCFHEGGCSLDHIKRVQEAGAEMYNQYLPPAKRRVPVGINVPGWAKEKI